MYQMGRTPPLNINPSPESIQAYATAWEGIQREIANIQVRQSMQAACIGIIRPTKITPEQVETFRREWLAMYEGPPKLARKNGKSNFTSQLLDQIEGTVE